MSSFDPQSAESIVRDGADHVWREYWKRVHEDRRLDKAQEHAFVAARPVETARSPAVGHQLTTENAPVLAPCPAVDHDGSTGSDEYPAPGLPAGAPIGERHRSRALEYVERLNLGKRMKDWIESSDPEFFIVSKPGYRLVEALELIDAIATAFGDRGHQSLPAWEQRVRDVTRLKTAARYASFRFYRAAYDMPNGDSTCIDESAEHLAKFLNAKLFPTSPVLQVLRPGPFRSHDFEEKAGGVHDPIRPLTFLLQDSGKAVKAMWESVPRSERTPGGRVG